MPLSPVIICNLTIWKISGNPISITMCVCAHLFLNIAIQNITLPIPDLHHKRAIIMESNPTKRPEGN